MASLPLLPTLFRFPGRFLSLVAALTVVAVPLLGAAPANDAFAEAELLTPGLAIEGSLEGATPDAERMDLLAGVSSSVWYRWTPSVDGQLTVRLQGMPREMSVEAYLGPSLAALSRVPRPGTINVEIDAKVGITYFLAVSGTGTSFVLQSRFDPLAPADAFADRTRVSGEHFEIVSGDRLFTAELEEGSSPGYGTLWWSWTAPASGMLVARANSAPPTGLLIAPYTIMAFLGNRLNALTVAPIEPYWGQRVVAGKTYALRMSVNYLSIEALAAQGRDIRATFDLWPIAPNEQFANRIRLSGASSLLAGDDSVSWLEDGEGSWNLATSLWWEWVAPFDGTMGLVPEGDNGGGSVLIFDQNPFETPAVQPLPFATTVVTGGRTYYLCLGSPMVGGGQAGAMRGYKTWRLSVTPGFAPLTVTPGPFSPSSGMLIGVNGPTGARAQISVSTDLNTWTPWTTLLLGPTRTDLWDADAVREPRRLYRVKIE
jgi:hypothetical protein